MNEYVDEIINFYMSTFENGISEVKREKFLKDEYGYIINDEKFICLLVNNFIMVQSDIMRDLKEINDRINKIDKKQSELKSEEYEFRKLSYCKRININAKEEIEHFLTDKAITYIKKRVIDKTNWIRSTEPLIRIFDKLPYDYSQCKQFYDPEYDFSTDTKYRFLLEHSSRKIQEKIELKAKSIDKYYDDLDNNIKNRNMLEKLIDGIRNHHVLIKRKEIFDTLKALYEEGKYQSFINLAVLQVEGLFYDFCFILNDEIEIENVGTLSVKAEKVFKDNPYLWLSTYPYYAFDAPVFRNKIAHNGLWNSHNLKNFCNELVLDLYSIIRAIKISNKLPYNLLYCVKAIRDQVKTIEIPKENYSTVLIELFEESQACKFGANEIFNTLKNKEQKREVLEFYKIEVNHTECTNLYEECCRITDIIYNEKTWDIILENLKRPEVILGEDSDDFIEFAKSITNNYISKFKSGSNLKEKCIEVSKTLNLF